MEYKPYIPDAAAWKHHFKQMVDGRMDHSSSFYPLARQPKSHEPAAQSIKVVAPSAQDVTQAKEELKREEKQVRKRLSEPVRKRPSKRGKSKLLKEETDLFSD